MLGRVSLFCIGLVSMTVVLAGCGANNDGQNVRRGLLRATSVPKSVPDAGKFRPAQVQSPDGTPVRGILR